MAAVPQVARYLNTALRQAKHQKLFDDDSKLLGLLAVLPPGFVRLWNDDVIGVSEHLLQVVLSHVLTDVPYIQQCIGPPL